MHSSSFLAPLLVLVMVSIVSAEDVSPAPPNFDVIIRGGTVYDGSGGEGRQADVALRGDRIAGVGDFKSATAKVTIDAHGLAVAPGFINMLSWSTESLIADGRSQSEIRQGVTTEIMRKALQILAVEDEKAVAQILAVVLGGPMAKVVRAVDGWEALIKIGAATQPFDVVITDHRMGPDQWRSRNRSSKTFRGFPLLSQRRQC